MALREDPPTRPDELTYEDGPAGLDEGARAENRENVYRNQYIPKEPARLTMLSVFCVISNRMIGSGIFVTPTTLVKYTQSLGITMLFWLAGAITTMCGIILFAEYGLHSPRFQVEKQERGRPRGSHRIAIPRSGGELYYLKDVFTKPKYFATVLYGIAFVLLGNVATNSMNFGTRVLQAAGHAESVSQWSTAENWAARGIALIVVTFTCLIHACWRLGGIYLNNAFAFVKIAMLLFVFITGCITWSGKIPRSPEAANNLNSKVAFDNPSTDPYAFAEAWLSVVFAFGGFNQANYVRLPAGTPLVAASNGGQVMGEIDNPKRTFKWPAILTVGIVSLLYLLVNIAYLVVVPAADQKAGKDIAVQFFKLTYGSLGTAGAEVAPRLLYAFMAVSALGNIIVMTFTAARVKQEIAKEGILPFKYFFSESKPIKGIAPLIRLFSKSYEGIEEDVPLGALFLHWIISVALIIFTCPLDPLNAYRILVSLYSYTIDAIPGVLLAIGMFYLRMRPSLEWESFLNRWVSLLVALVYGASMLFPIVTGWIPPSPAFARGLTYPWFTTATVSWSVVVGLGVLYWAGFLYLYPLIRHPNETMIVKRYLFIRENNVLYHEMFRFDWDYKKRGEGPIKEETKLGGPEDDPRPEY